jgi:hypothetical protein
MQKAFKRGHKYRAKRTVVDGITFPSALEARRYTSLRLLQDQGWIERLERQPVYKLTIGGVDCGKYIPDFRYVQIEPDGRRSAIVIEDCKGFRTPLYRFKIKVWKALYPGLDFREVTA